MDHCEEIEPFHWGYDAEHAPCTETPCVACGGCPAGCDRCQMPCECREGDASCAFCGDLCRQHTDTRAAICALHLTTQRLARRAGWVMPEAA